MYWFNYLVQHHGPLFAGMVTNVVPLGAVLLGWADQETVSPLQLAALIGIVIMVALVQYGGARRDRPAELAPHESAR
jgi:drug/metabolite transporter (DMT)-like permease